MTAVLPNADSASLRFTIWEAYGKAMQGLASDAEYQRRYAEASKLFELQGRALMVAEDL